MTKTVVIEEIKTVAAETQGDVDVLVVQPQPSVVTVPLPERTVVEVERPLAGVEVRPIETKVVEIEKVVEKRVIVEPPPQIVEVVSRGPQGVPGDISGGGNAVSIVGYPVQLVDGNPDDLLSFTGTEWRNKAQEKVTDGGNF